jgi:ribosomal protein S2
LDGTHHPLVYADDVNLFCSNINAVRRKAEALRDSSEEAGRKVNTKERNCSSMLMSQKKLTKTIFTDIANISSENVMKIRYFGITLTNESYVHGEIFGLKGVM